MIHNLKEARCPAEYTLNYISGRWKVLILWYLGAGVKRFSELKEALGEVTTKMLTQQLREMEADGLIQREVYKQVPPKVEYALTPLGQSLDPIIQSMCQWALQHSNPPLKPLHR